MPSAATQSPGTTSNASRGGGAPRPTVPFIRASARHVEAPFFDQTFTLNANLQDFGVIEVPAYGYIRNLVFYVNAVSTANAAAVTFNEDAPWTALQNIQFNEPNGAQIVQVNDGYELYLINKFSGYMGPGNSNDHRGDPLYRQSVAVGPGDGGSFSYMVRVPVELDLRSALGSLPNQAANATFRIRAALAPLGTIYGTSPTTPPTVRVRIFAETWDQPEVASGGVTNQVTPPAMNTTQFWSRQVYNLGGGGSQTTRLTRVGNYLRNQIFILRSAGGSGLQGAGPRASAEELWTTPQSTVGGIAGVSDGQVTFFIDSRPIQVINDRYWRELMWERSGGYGGFYGALPTAYDTTVGGVTGTTVAATFQNANDTAFGLENGVRVLDWMTEFDGNYGRENRDLWQPTLGSTRFELQSNYGVLTNGTLTVLTNDVAIAGNVFLS